MTTKITPSNCKHTTCPYNLLAPPENSQECIACPGNKDPSHEPKAEAPSE